MKELLQTELQFNSDSSAHVQQVSPTCPKPIVSGCSGHVTRTRRHMSANIEGMLRNYKKRSMAGLITDEKGREMSDAKARLFLSQCLTKGWKKIPCGDCEGFDPFENGCPGHPIFEDVAE